MSRFIYSRETIETIFEEADIGEYLLVDVLFTPCITVYVAGDTDDLQYILKEGHHRYGVCIRVDSNARDQIWCFDRGDWVPKSMIINVFDFLLNKSVRQINVSLMLPPTVIHDNIVKRIRTCASLIKTLEHCTECNSLYNLKAHRRKAAKNKRRTPIKYTKICVNTECGHTEVSYVS